ncbi:unnamed protein product [Blepharisma stoltei]|uniref:isopentenyl-diphosphate Delta-isomerase n=1 Tax=Blepharisma stoltei TaxID=1481888 RepID=A0AAU9JA68_9CILI|nr:unnamed protein product [Blepharisma stoltei]
MFKILQFTRHFGSKVYDPKQLETFRQQLFLVNDQDEFIKTIDKYTAHNWEWICSNDALPHRAFSLLIFNKNFELLLQQRSSIKVTFPLYWSNSCCSHPIVGRSIFEICDEATERAKFELGTDLCPRSLKFLSKVLYKSQSDQNWGEYEMDYVFFVMTDKYSNENRPVINSEEVNDIMWINRSGIEQFIDRKDLKVTPWFDIFIRNTDLLKWWEAFEKGKIEDYENSDEILDLSQIQVNHRL